jgi:hypothetical protein
VLIGLAFYAFGAPTRRQAALAAAASQAPAPQAPAVQATDTAQPEAPHADTAGG